ncbi:MAG: serine/threonine-protein kinase [Acidimicrobiales bacterium]
MTIVAGYELERQIGAGASGTVWRAHRLGPVPQVVALKRLRAGSGAVDVDRIRREASVLSTLDHPHVVRVLEVLADGDGVALAMQYAPGGSLEALLEERGPLTAGQAAAVAAPIADALGSAHRRGIVHGDVKPANILFTSDGEPLLTDFGVARTLGRLTSDTITGTAEYLAPELLAGAQPDARTDIYSLAVVCYEALAGRPPYSGAVPLAIVRAAETGDHLPLTAVPDVPEALANTIEQAMARDPAQRFVSADLFARALRASVPPDQLRLPGIAAGAMAAPTDDVAKGTRTFGPRPPRPEKPMASRRDLKIPILLAVGLVAAGLIFVLRGGLDRDDEGGGDCAAFEPAPQVIEGDPEGDGSSTTATYQLEQSAAPDCVVFARLHITIAGEARAFRIGGPGDQLFLGDWNCDQVDTPGVYEPGNGQISYHDTWPVRGAEEAQPRVEQAPADGRASLQAGGEGRCDSLAVAN